MYKVTGWMLLTLLFVIMFYLTVIFMGATLAIAAWIIAIVLVAILFGATYLISK